MYYLGRIVGAFFNQFFRFLFWNKKGQKILFIAVIFVIAVCFIKLGEVSAVEEVEDINYEVQSYYDSVINHAIQILYQNWDNISDNRKNIILDSNYKKYWYFGQADGSSYNNARPIYSSNLHCLYVEKFYYPQNYSATSYDYLGVTSYSMILKTNCTSWDINTSGSFSPVTRDIYCPLFVSTYESENWTTFVNAMRNNDMTTITALLEDIKEEQQLINENLTNDDVSNVSADLPQDTAVDPTDSLWGDMFDQVRTAVTSTSVSPISITIPFIDYSTIIEPAIYSPMIRIRNTMRPLYDFIILSWWFGASMWIVKDIHKYLEQIKNGDITAKDTNIKTEVL